MNQRKIGTILSYVQIIVSNTISLIYTPYMLRMMGQSEYGIYGTANSLISYLSILSMGIGGAYIRFNAQCRANDDKEEESRLNGMFLTIFSGLSVLVIIGGGIFVALAGKLVKSTFSAEELYKLRMVMILLTINMAITFVCNVVMMALQAYEQFVIIRCVLIAMGIITPILNVIALRKGGRAITITFISLLLSIISYMIFLVYARKKIYMKFIFRGFRKDIVKELFVFSSFLFLNSITDQITFSTDNIVLSAVKGTTVTAIYSIGAQFKGYFMNFSSSISNVFAPQINRIVAEGLEKKYLDEIFQRVGRIQFYVVSLILIGYSIVGKSFIRIWAGEDYRDSFEIGLLLIVAVFVPAFQNIGIEIQKAMNMHKARSVVYFLIALFNVALTIPASVKWGGIGAAAATTISMFFGTVLFMNWYYWKKMGLDIPQFWREIISIIPGFIPPILVVMGLKNIYTIRTLFDVLLFAIAICVTCGCSVWLFSMNDYEKKLVREPIMRIMRRRKRRKDGK